MRGIQHLASSASFAPMDAQRGRDPASAPHIHSGQDGRPPHICRAMSELTFRPDEERAARSVFRGSSEMAARCRAFDWSATPLGPVSEWPASLRTIVDTMLSSRHPMFLWWGPELVQIFNDGYLPSFGTSGRDRQALGAKGREHWVDIWSIIGGEIEQVLATGEATWHEDQLVPIMRNGRLEDVYWTYSYSAVRDDDGEVAGVLVVVQETTARVELLAARDRARADAESARARLAELFRQAPAFIAMLRGPDFIFEIANESYHQLIGRRDIIGKPLFEALPEVRGQGFEELLQKVIDTGETVVGREVPLTLARTPGADSELRYVTFVYAPFLEPDGTRSGVFAHGIDVTDMVNTRHDTEAARAVAEAADRAKGELLATISHELRTPLNAIGGYAQLLELGVYGPMSEDQKGVVGRIQQSERHLLSRVNDLLTFAKLEGGHVDYAIEELALASVISSVFAMVEPQLTAKHLEYNVHVGDDVTVLADRERLEQILLNLLSNAIKFTESGGRVAIDVGSRTDRADGADLSDVVMLRVSDSGVGIPRSAQDSIFTPYVQLEQPAGSEGTGLGLAISRDLARGMGGELRVRSSPGTGSTFTLSLRAAKMRV